MHSASAGARIIYFACPNLSIDDDKMSCFLTLSQHFEAVLIKRSFYYLRILR